MKKPEFLNTVTIGQTRQKYRDISESKRNHNDTPDDGRMIKAL